MARDQDRGLEEAIAIAERAGAGVTSLAPSVAAALRTGFTELRRQRDGYAEDLSDLTAQHDKAVGRIHDLEEALAEERTSTQPVPSCLSEEGGCEKHGRPDCEDCYLDALAPSTDLLGERLKEEAVLDEAEDAYKSSPVGGRRALEAAFDAALEAIKNAR